MPQKSAEIQQRFCCAFCLSLPSNKSMFDGDRQQVRGKGNLTFSVFSEKWFSCLLLAIKINLLSKWILSKLIVLSLCSVSPRNALKYCYVFACSWLIEILINYMNKPRKIKVGFSLNHVSNGPNASYIEFGSSHFAAWPCSLLHSALVGWGRCKEESELCRERRPMDSVGHHSWLPASALQEWTLMDTGTLSGPSHRVVT